MGISITDSLLLAKVKIHLQVDVDVTEDDTLIQTYIDNSLAYVTNYTQKTFEVYNNIETFMLWENDTIFLDWETEVRAAAVSYTDTSNQTKTLNVVVYADNVIREVTPVDYNGGNITVVYTPYIEQMQIPVSHQARLLLIGTWYDSSRSAEIVGAQVNELSVGGVNNLLNSIKLGFI